jgi:UDP-3-O-[3-hydroxymyristoyl] glucosamine N-acyltransferase
MADPRFFISKGPIALGSLLASVSASAEGRDPSAQITGLAALSDAKPGDLTFLEGAKGSGLIETNASACLVRPKDAARLPTTTIAITSQQPRSDFAKIAPLLIVRRDFSVDAPRIDPSAIIANGAIIGPGAIIGANVEIGEGTRIGANAVIGPGCCIGRSCIIGAGVVIMCALIGDRVIIGANSVIGESGFGVALGSGPPIDVPQIGRAIIQDGVSLGAMVCVDRGAFSDTIVGENSKLDNQVQIAHNCILGRGVVMAAQSGLSGSVTLGDGAVLGGQVGIADHTKVGAGAIVMGKSGTFGDVPAREVWGGYPARPRALWLRETASLVRLARKNRVRPSREGEQNDD